MKFEFEKSFFLSFLFLLDLNALKKFVVIFIFVLIHELTHVFIGKIFGLKTKKIVFGLFGMHAEIINFDLSKSPSKKQEYKSPKKQRNSVKLISQRTIYRRFKDLEI